MPVLKEVMVVNFQGLKNVIGEMTIQKTMNSDWKIVCWKNKCRSQMSNLAAATLLVDTRSWSDCHLLLTSGHRRGLSVCLDGRSHCIESLLDIGGILRTCLNKRDIHLISKFLSLGGIYLPLGVQVGLVAHEELVYVLTGVAIDLVQPLLDVIKSIVICCVIDHHDAMSSTVVAAGDGPETFLPGSVPNLQLNGFAIQ